VEYQHEHTAEAKDYLDKALALDPNNAMCHRVLGSVYDQMADKPHALEHYERAIALDPSVAGDADIKQRVAELKN
jgi:Tfp pilus assembly protein PilF